MGNDGEPTSDVDEVTNSGGTNALMWDLTHRYYDALPELCIEWEPAKVPDPQLVMFNAGLANELGLDPEGMVDRQATEVFAGNAVPVGSVPVALGYAGHQFGGYSPRLGDGRALLLGEWTGPDGTMVDIHLKGSGRTPFARGGDGKATLGPMLREYLISEAMYALDVPTTRSLAVATTGEMIRRESPEPGAVLTRTASSHIRVGTFEYALRLGGVDLIRRLADHAIARHYPHLLDQPDRYAGLLTNVVDAQALLIAKWMSTGFIHGVMNTDNMTISGQGIDYGPCAFMDTYHPNTVFSSIDHGGRYAYGNQARIAAWNLARLAETMLELLDDNSDMAVEIATNIVNGFADRFQANWREIMAAKLGLTAPNAAIDSLINDLLGVMQAGAMDWTTTFRHLAARLRDSVDADRNGPGPEGEFESWVNRWLKLLGDDNAEPLVVAKGMDLVNPIYIPRNHLVDAALQSAVKGDLEPFNELCSAITNPFVERVGLEHLAHPAPVEFTDSFQTFCGT